MQSVFDGCIPALMTPCTADRKPDHQELVKTAKHLIASGMRAVVYCGSMGDWPLLTDKERQAGVEALVKAGIPVVVGTGAQNTKLAAEHAAHAKSVGAQGLMVIPRVLSRGTSMAAQREHFTAVLKAAVDLPSVIYNSPYYGYETKADLFFQLRDKFSHLVGFKEFGGAAALRYAAEFITNRDKSLSLLVGVDTQVCHGLITCGGRGVITGIGNILPREILHLVDLCHHTVKGDVQAHGKALELERALGVLSSFDEGADLVLYYKYLMTLEGHSAYGRHFYETDALSDSQRNYAETQYRQFKTWYANWSAQ